MTSSSLFLSLLLSSLPSFSFPFQVSLLFSQLLVPGWTKSSFNKKSSISSLVLVWVWLIFDSLSLDFRTVLLLFFWLSVPRVYFKFISPARDKQEWGEQKNGSSGKRNGREKEGNEKWASFQKMGSTSFLSASQLLDKIYGSIPSATFRFLFILLFFSPFSSLSFFSASFPQPLSVLLSLRPFSVLFSSEILTFSFFPFFLKLLLPTGIDWEGQKLKRIYWKVYTMTITMELMERILSFSPFLSLYFSLSLSPWKMDAARGFLHWFLFHFVLNVFFGSQFFEVCVLIPKKVSLGNRSSSLLKNFQQTQFVMTWGEEDSFLEVSFSETLIEKKENSRKEIEGQRKNKSKKREKERKLKERERETREREGGRGRREWMKGSKCW